MSLNPDLGEGAVIMGAGVQTQLCPRRTSMGPQLPGRSGSLVQGGVPAVAALSYGVLDMNSRLLTSQPPFSKDAPGALVPFRADLSNSHHSTMSTEPPGG